MPSFKQILLTPHATSQPCAQAMDIEEDEQTPDLETVEDDSLISLSEEDKRRMYLPWSFSMIIKVFGKKLSHVYLKNKLATLWRLSEEITLIDPRHEYYILKLLKEENAQKSSTKALGLQTGSSYL